MEFMTILPNWEGVLEDRARVQRDLDKLKEWAKRNLMEFGNDRH